MKKDQNGFTIIELMLATAIFTVVLVIVVAAIIFATQVFVKGEIIAGTEDATKNIITAISQDIEFNQASSVLPPQTYSTGGETYTYYCIGNHFYIFTLDQQIAASQSLIGTSPQYVDHALLRFSGSCPQNTDPSGTNYIGTYIPADFNTQNVSGATEMLAQHLRLGQLTITPSLDGYTISVVVAYGDDAVLQTTPADPNHNVQQNYTYSCVPENQGGRFCAYSALTTTISSRIQ